MTDPTTPATTAEEQEKIKRARSALILVAARLSHGAFLMSNCFEDYESARISSRQVAEKMEKAGDLLKNYAITIRHSVDFLTPLAEKFATLERDAASDAEVRLQLASDLAAAESRESALRGELEQAESALTALGCRLTEHGWEKPCERCRGEGFYFYASRGINLTCEDCNGTCWLPIPCLPACRHCHGTAKVAAKVKP